MFSYAMRRILLAVPVIIAITIYPIDKTN